MSRKLTHLIRLTAWVIVFTFAIEQVCQAAPLGASPSTLETSLGALPARSITQLIQDPSRIDIPFKHVSVKEIHSGSNGKLIIHIQDAHANFAAQKNLAQTLDHLMTRYSDLSLVLSEGGEGDASLGAIASQMPAKDLEIAARRLMFDGMLSGHEYLNLTRQPKMQLIGIEDRERYDENLLAYARLAEHRTSTLKYLHRIQIAVKRLKNKFYPKSLLRFEEVKQEYDATGEFLKNYQQLLSLSQAVGIKLTQYPTLLELKAIQDQEGALDFVLLNSEQAALVEQMTKRGSKEIVKEYLESFKFFSSSPVAQLLLLKKIMTQAQQKGVYTDTFSELSKYLEYLERFAGLNHSDLFLEMEQLESEMFAQTLAEGDAQTLWAIDRYIGYLEKAFNIQMTSDEFRVFVANEAEFPTRAWQGFLNKHLAESNFYREMIPFKSNLDNATATLKEFYRGVDARDEAFLKHSERALANKDHEAAFLIAGGYHTAHLTQMLKEKDYSYIVLAPTVTGATDQAKYEDVLLAPVNQVQLSRQTTSDESTSTLSRLLASEAESDAYLMNYGHPDRKNVWQLISLIQGARGKRTQERSMPSGARSVHELLGGDQSKIVVQRASDQGVHTIVLRDDFSESGTDLARVEYEASDRRIYIRSLHVVPALVEAGLGQLVLHTLKSDVFNIDGEDVPFAIYSPNLEPNSDLVTTYELAGFRKPRQTEGDVQLFYAHDDWGAEDLGIFEYTITYEENRRRWKEHLRDPARESTRDNIEARIEDVTSHLESQRLESSWSATDYREHLFNPTISSYESTFLRYMRVNGRLAASALYTVYGDHPQTGFPDPHVEFIRLNVLPQYEHAGFGQALIRNVLLYPGFEGTLVGSSELNSRSWELPIFQAAGFSLDETRRASDVSLSVYHKNSDYTPIDHLQLAALYANRVYRIGRVVSRIYLDFLRRQVIASEVYEDYGSIDEYRRAFPDSDRRFRELEEVHEDLHALDRTLQSITGSVQGRYNLPHALDDTLSLTERLKEAIQAWNHPAGFEPQNLSLNPSYDSYNDGLTRFLRDEATYFRLATEFIENQDPEAFVMDLEEIKRYVAGPQGLLDAIRSQIESYTAAAGARNQTEDWDKDGVDEEAEELMRNQMRREELLRLQSTAYAHRTPDNISDKDLSMAYGEVLAAMTRYGYKSTNKSAYPSAYDVYQFLPIVDTDPDFHTAVAYANALITQYNERHPDAPLTLAGVNAELELDDPAQDSNQNIPIAKLFPNAFLRKTRGLMSWQEIAQNSGIAEVYVREAVAKGWSASDRSDLRIEPIIFEQTQVDHLREVVRIMRDYGKRTGLYGVASYLDVAGTLGLTNPRVGDRDIFRVVRSDKFLPQYNLNQRRVSESKSSRRNPDLKVAPRKTISALAPVMQTLNGLEARDRISRRQLANKLTITENALNHRLTQLRDFIGYDSLDHNNVQYGHPPISNFIEDLILADVGQSVIRSSDPEAGRPTADDIYTFIADEDGLASFEEIAEEFGLNNSDVLAILSPGELSMHQAQDARIAAEQLAPLVYHQNAVERLRVIVNALEEVDEGGHLPGVSSYLELARDLGYTGRTKSNLIFADVDPEQFFKCVNHNRELLNRQGADPQQPYLMVLENRVLSSIRSLIPLLLEGLDLKTLRQRLGIGINALRNRLSVLEDNLGYDFVNHNLATQGSGPVSRPKRSVGYAKHKQVYDAGKTSGARRATFKQKYPDSLIPEAYLRMLPDLGEFEDRFGSYLLPRLGRSEFNNDDKAEITKFLQALADIYQTRYQLIQVSHGESLGEDPPVHPNFQGLIDQHARLLNPKQTLTPPLKAAAALDLVLDCGYCAGATVSPILNKYGLEHHMESVMWRPAAVLDPITRASNDFASSHTYLILNILGEPFVFDETAFQFLGRWQSRQGEVDFNFLNDAGVLVMPKAIMDHSRTPFYNSGSNVHFTYTGLDGKGSTEHIQLVDARGRFENVLVDIRAKIPIPRIGFHPGDKFNGMRISGPQIPSLALEFDADGEGILREVLLHQNQGPKAEYLKRQMVPMSTNSKEGLVHRNIQRLTLVQSPSDLKVELHKEGGVVETHIYDSNGKFQRKEVSSASGSRAELLEMVGENYVVIVNPRETMRAEDTQRDLIVQYLVELGYEPQDILLVPSWKAAKLRVARNPEMYAGKRINLILNNSDTKVTRKEMEQEFQFSYKRQEQDVGVQYSLVDRGQVQLLNILKRERDWETEITLDHVKRQVRTAGEIAVIMSPRVSRRLRPTQESLDLKREIESVYSFPEDQIFIVHSMGSMTRLMRHNPESFKRLIAMVASNADIHSRKEGRGFFGQQGKYFHPDMIGVTKKDANPQRITERNIEELIEAKIERRFAPSNNDSPVEYPHQVLTQISNHETILANLLAYETDVAEGGGKYPKETVTKVFPVVQQAHALLIRVLADSEWRDGGFTRYEYYAAYPIAKLNDAASKKRTKSLAILIELDLLEERRGQNGKLRIYPTTNALELDAEFSALSLGQMRFEAQELSGLLPQLYEEIFGAEGMRKNLREHFVFLEKEGFLKREKGPGVSGATVYRYRLTPAGRYAAQHGLDKDQHALRLQTLFADPAQSSLSAAEQHGLAMGRRGRAYSKPGGKTGARFASPRRLSRAEMYIHDLWWQGANAWARLWRTSRSELSTQTKSKILTRVVKATERIIRKYPIQERDELWNVPDDEYAREASEFMHSGFRYQNHGKSFIVFDSSVYPSLVFKGFKSTKPLYDFYRAKFELGLIGLLHRETSSEIVQDRWKLTRIPGLAPFDCGVRACAELKADMTKPPEEEEASIRQDLLVRLDQAGILWYDHTPQNWGYIDGEPVVIDLGDVGVMLKRDVKSKLQSQIKVDLTRFRPMTEARLLQILGELGVGTSNYDVWAIAAYYEAVVYEGLSEREAFEAALRAWKYHQASGARAAQDVFEVIQSRLSQYGATYLDAIWAQREMMSAVDYLMFLPPSQSTIIKEQSSKRAKPSWLEGPAKFNQIRRTWTHESPQKRTAFEAEAFSELGRLLRDYWRNQHDGQWFNAIGPIGQYIAGRNGYHIEPQLFDYTQRRLDYLISGSNQNPNQDVEDLAHALWFKGVRIASHIRHFGIHSEDLKRAHNDETELMFTDNDYLVETTQDFIATLRRLRRDPLWDRALAWHGSDTNLTFGQVMSWGLRVMLDPNVHHPKFALTSPIPALAAWNRTMELAREKSSNDTDLGLVEDYMARILEPFLVRDEDRWVVAQDVQDIIGEAFDISEMSFEQLQLRSPDLYHHQAMGLTLRNLNFPPKTEAFLTKGEYVLPRDLPVMIVLKDPGYYRRFSDNIRAGHPTAGSPAFVIKNMRANSPNKFESDVGRQYVTFPDLVRQSGRLARMLPGFVVGARSRGREKRFTQNPASVPTAILSRAISMDIGVPMSIGDYLIFVQDIELANEGEPGTILLEIVQNGRTIDTPTLNDGDLYALDEDKLVEIIVRIESVDRAAIEVKAPKALRVSRDARSKTRGEDAKPDRVDIRNRWTRLLRAISADDPTFHEKLPGLVGMVEKAEPFLYPLILEKLVELGDKATIFTPWVEERMREVLSREKEAVGTKILRDGTVVLGNVDKYFAQGTLPLLTELSQYPDAHVRRNAKQAIRKIQGARIFVSHPMVVKNEKGLHMKSSEQVVYVAQVAALLGFDVSIGKAGEARKTLIGSQTMPTSLDFMRALMALLIEDNDQVEIQLEAIEGDINEVDRDLVIQLFEQLLQDSVSLELKTTDEHFHDVYIKPIERRLQERGIPNSRIAYDQQLAKEREILGEQESDREYGLSKYDEAGARAAVFRSYEELDLDVGLEAFNFGIRDRQRETVKLIFELGQAHVFNDWKGTRNIDNRAKHKYLDRIDTLYRRLNRVAQAERIGWDESTVQSIMIQVLNKELTLRGVDVHVLVTNADGSQAVVGFMDSAIAKAYKLKARIPAKQIVTPDLEYVSDLISHINQILELLEPLQAALQQENLERVKGQDHTLTRMLGLVDKTRADAHLILDVLNTMASSESGVPSEYHKAEEIALAEVIVLGVPTGSVGLFFRNVTEISELVEGGELQLPDLEAINRGSAMSEPAQAFLERVLAYGFALRAETDPDGARIVSDNKLLPEDSTMPVLAADAARLVQDKPSWQGVIAPLTTRRLVPQGTLAFAHGGDVLMFDQAPPATLTGTNGVAFRIAQSEIVPGIKGRLASWMEGFNLRLTRALEELKYWFNGLFANDESLIDTHLYFDVSGFEGAGYAETLRVLSSLNQRFVGAGARVSVGSLDPSGSRALLEQARDQGLEVVESLADVPNATLILSSRHVREGMELSQAARGFVVYDPAVQADNGTIQHTNIGYLIMQGVGISDVARQLEAEADGQLDSRTLSTLARASGKSKRALQDAALVLAAARAVTPEALRAARTFKLPLIQSALNSLRDFLTHLSAIITAA